MPTHYKGPKRRRAVLDAYIKLMRASGAVHGRTGRIAREYGLTQSQFGVMETLRHIGPLNQRMVGEKLFFTEGNVNHVVKNLEKRGLLKRERDEYDARSMVLTLTTKGNKLIDQAFEAYVDELVDGFAALSEAETVTLDKLLRKLGIHARSF